MVHDAALVEIADELVHAVFMMELLYSVDAIIRVAEHPDLTVDVVEVYTFDPRQDLTEGLEALDVAVAEGRSRSAASRRKRISPARILARACARLAATCTGKASAVSPAARQASRDRPPARLELVRRIDQRRGENRQLPPRGEWETCQGCWRRSAPAGAATERPRHQLDRGTEILSVNENVSLVQAPRMKSSASSKRSRLSSGGMP